MLKGRRAAELQRFWVSTSKKQDEAKMSEAETTTLVSVNEEEAIFHVLVEFDLALRKLNL